ncbi:hypothetical protein [Treponema sp.]|uniref:hypothetical protein n=1 Tax=Treponema sp. TaxID=166 RepID=UPI00298E9388|nr:hypothetical protein [Treponema sp.]MCR5612295.1 hypothetical protein [Treponema sp.]
MENIILNTWIEIKSSLKVRLLIKPDENGRISKKGLVVKGRQVFDNSGKSLDFGDAYPITTDHGKLMITKQFIKSWL